MNKAPSIRRHIDSHLRQTRMHCFPALMLAAVMLMCAANAQAANQYWDSAATAGYQHGDGLWSTADSYWGTLAGNVTPSVWVNNNQAFFAGPAGTSLISLKTSVATVGMMFTNAGTYTVAISDGGILTNTAALTMAGSNSRVELNGGSSSATWYNTSTLRIGDTSGGYNAFVVNGAGVPGSAYATNTSTIYLGINATSQGNLLMVTNGGTLISAANDFIGYLSPSNRAEITGGGALWNVGNKDLYVGYNAGSTGNVLRIDGQGVAGGARVTNVAVFTVGNVLSTAQNELVITNGGQYFGNASIHYIGNASPYNRATITGAGSLMRLGGNVYLYVGYGADAIGNVMTIDNGAVVTNTYLRIGSSGSQNRMVITNGGALYSLGAVYVGHSSASNIAEVTGGGALWNLGNNILTIGYFTGSTGNVLRIDGQGVVGGARVTNVAAFTVGSTSPSGQHELVVTNGGQLYVTGDSTIGSLSSYNRATVTGTGSLMRLGAKLYVGDSATGNVLTIDSGAVVTNVTDLRIGNAASQNQIVITNGGVFYSAGTSAYLGNAGVSNSVKVTGPASGWNLGKADLYIGNGVASDNILTIDQGGTVSNIATLSIRPTNNLALMGGTLSVSNLTCTSGFVLNIGDGTQVAELVMQGGTHTNNSGFLIQSNAVVSGRGRLAGGSSGVVTFAAGSTLRPGVPGSAATTIATLQLGPSTWQGGSTLEMNVTNVTGTAGINWDSLQLLGSMNFVTNGGKLKIKLNSAGETAGGFNSNVSRIIPLVTCTNAAITASDIVLDTNDFLIGSNWVVDVTTEGIQLLYQRPSPFIYVATNGSNGGGSSWSTAYTNLQEALNNSQSFDTIYLAGGQTFEGGVPLGPTSPNNSIFLLQNRVNITLRGGYEADPLLPQGDHPGTNNPVSWPTILKQTSLNSRVLAISAVSNALIESVTITNGWLTTAGHNQGGGVYLKGCRNVTLSKCDIVGNKAFYGDAYGGGLYLVDCVATLVDSRLVGNSTPGGGNARSYGGGAYVASGGTLTILRTLVSANNSAGSGSGYEADGGGLFIAIGAALDIRESVISSNSTSSGVSANPGGGVHNQGSLWMQNCLVVSNRSYGTPAHSDGVYFYSGTATVVNCTVADNNEVGLRYNTGVVAVSNSIIWGHTAADLHNFPTDGNGKLPAVWYSCISNSPNAGFQSCMDNDPLFADRVHYHLQSTEGFYTNGYFNGGYWTNAAADSPVIDRGDPDADWSREPAPENGGRINMGAYGGTEVASKTADVVADPPAVITLGAVKWGHRTATLRGEVTDTGGDTPDVWFLYWIVGDPTTNLVSGGVQSAGFENVASGLTPGATYQYVAVASNQAGAVQSGVVEGFTLHPAASTLYAATNGNNTAGTNWSSAYSDLQTALDIAEAGDVIYAAGQTFNGEGTVLTDQAFLWQNATNVTLRGGYQATSDIGLPGARNSDTWPTIIRRSGANNVRVLTMSAVSNAVIEKVIIRDGYRSSATTPLGGGVYLSGCQAITFSGCSIVTNTALGANPKGGGMYLVNSDAELTDSILASNKAAGSGNSYAYGGGASVDSGGTLTILRSQVRDNRAVGGNSYIAYGGGLFVGDNGALDIRESVINYNSTFGSVGANPGGGVFSKARLWMQNCLVASNRDNSTPPYGDGIFSYSGTSTVVNCTVADNYGVGLRYNSGVLSVTNSIIWGHTVSNVWTYPVSGGVFSNMSHTLIGGYPFMDGVNGCLTNNPLFDDQVYYHLQSKKGVYRGGYFSGGTGWANATSNSPGLDAGTNLPSIVWQNEPTPNGKLVNMGAYGGTSVASISVAPVGTIIMLR